MHQSVQDNLLILVGLITICSSGDDMTLKVLEALKSSEDIIYISLQAEHCCANFCLVITEISHSAVC